MDGDGDDFEGVRGFFRWLERKKYKVHVRVFLSRYRGYLTCPDCHGTRLRREARDVHVGGVTIDKASARTVREAEQFFADAAAHREGSGDRRQGAEGDPAAPRLPARRRSRLPDARSPVVDAVGRRSAAHQPRDVARLGAGRHAVRARRAVDWPAHARQRAADRDPPAAPRSGQHRDRRRARRRHDRGGGSPRRHGPRRRRARRPRRVFGLARGPDQRTAIADGEVSARRVEHSDAGVAPQGHAAAHPAVWRDRAQSQGRRHRDPAEHADLCHRRQRIGQVDARARRAVCRAEAREGRLGSQGRRASAARRPRVRQRRRAGRSDADRPHAALESGDLPEGVRSDPRAVCGAPRTRNRAA